MMWGNYGMGLWGWGFGALILVGVVILIGVLVRLFSTPRAGAPVPGAVTGETGATPPKQILDERYAKGEMTTEEYQERLTGLGL
ncbi:SHOCT domain-containing protein [Salinibacterium sp. G-O1]|uniref:SHOCT domain-containing protein n=1 Tax=Salinibacterium sp. G-O1 TaxID=3046208 RepID=UPI0024BB487A|nr:SHOCT domain-containing protein [Salinibacterium sp. G-O1]MDJ0333958.1 SHOCT domain-containing protein [Salinibacterium sp. G-O1]